MNYHVRKIRNSSRLTSVKIENDFTNGPIFKQMILFAIPLMLTNILQILFNTADVVVLGVLVGDDAVAAVGSTGPLINFLTSLVIGLSMGVNVVASKHLGSHNEEGVQKTIGMSILLSVISGAIIAIVGWFGAKFFLTLMDCDAEVIEMSTTYLKFYCLGVPLVILYNFLSAIMRAAGDSKRPFVYLLISGIVNVGLNVFFILVCNMTVEGVAIATVLSQGLSSLLCIIQLIGAKGIVKLRAKFIKFYKAELLEVVRIGLPAGIQSSLFSLSNVFIQSTINKCGKLAMAGSSYAIQIESYVYTSLHSISMALMTFVSQNFGAKKIDRIYKALTAALSISITASLILGTVGLLLVKPIIGAIAKNQEVVDYAFKRALFVCLPYFLCGIMEVFSYTMRAIGRSVTSMIISLLGACLLRIVWVVIMFSFFPSYSLIFVTYPATWVITSAVLAVMLFPMLKKLKIKFELEQNA